MPYARFDDRYDDHKKIKRALRREPAAVALHAMAITYANRHNTNGDVDIEWVDEKLALMPYQKAQRGRVLKVLLDLNLLERKDPDTFVVHDFLDWNLSREQRQALSEQGRRGGRAKPGPRGPDSDGSSSGQSKGSSEGLSGGSSTPFATPTPTPTPSQEARKRATRRVDQSQVPDDFPNDLRASLNAVLPILRTVFELRGGIQPMPRGVALALMRNPRADHVAVARSLEHWLTAGKGQRAKCADIAARFGDWVADEPAADRVGATVVAMPRSGVATKNAWQAGYPEEAS